MNLGFGLLSAQLRPGETDWSIAYDETIRLALEAERLGYRSVWTTEHHFVDDGYMPSLLVVSAAMAAATTRIEIGTGVILAPLHDPIRLAEDAATVQLLSGGRLILGLGLGWNPAEFAGLRANLHQRGRAMEEILNILPAAWSGDLLDHSGEVYDIPAYAVRPTPHQDIPIVVGGGAEAAVRRAARLSAGFFSNAGPGRIEQQTEWIRDEFERSGRSADDFRFIHYSVMFPANSVEEGWEEIAGHAGHLFWKYSDMEASAGRTTPQPDPLPVSPEQAEALHGRAIVGPPDLIVEQLQGIRERVGMPVEFVARSFFHTLPHNVQLEVMQRLAEEVGPHL